jgi:hypothetical protein
MVLRHACYSIILGYSISLFCMQWAIQSRLYWLEGFLGLSRFGSLALPSLHSLNIVSWSRRLWKNKGHSKRAMIDRTDSRKANQPRISLDCLLLGYCGRRLFLGTCNTSLCKIGVALIHSIHYIVIGREIMVTALVVGVGYLSKRGMAESNRHKMYAPFTQ